MTGRERIEAYLREKRIPFMVHHHPVADAAQRAAAREHVLGRVVARVVVAFADGRMALFVLPAQFRVDVNRAAAATSAGELVIASEAEVIRAFSDCELGAMPPFGHPYDIDVYVDRRLAAQREIVFDAGTRTETMLMNYVDYARLAKPIVADFALGESSQHRRAKTLGGPSRKRCTTG